MKVLVYRVDGPHMHSPSSWGRQKDASPWWRSESTKAGSLDSVKMRVEKLRLRFVLFYYFHKLSGTVETVIYGGA